MIVSTLDIAIVVVILMITLGVGFWVSKRSGKSSSEFFLSGRNMPWWLLGISMVATTFSTDTPNLVTDLVRQGGVANNWVWWAFLLTGMLTVFVYARLWRITGIYTDMEFYELRYGGKPARFLRYFRAVYLGLAFNVLAMSAVCLAAIKIGEVMFGLEAIYTIGIGCGLTMIFSAAGGFRGVILTDFLLFFIAMSGAIGAAIVAVNLPEVGGLSKLLSHPVVAEKMTMLPTDQGPDIWIPLLLIPLAVQWWSSWYPGAEPGGGGYIAQRMLAARDENHAIKATLLFNIMHYAVRPWPWILVALASIVVFPDLASLQEAFPAISDSKLGHDVAYSAMLTYLPSGLLGLVLASLVAAFMSTISTHLNWGASYLVQDVYKRFHKPNASEKDLVWWGRGFTVLLMLLSASFALYLTNAKEIFDIILMFGAGTGLLFILRWFWWRITAWAELVAMIVSGILSMIFNFSDIIPQSWPSYSPYLLVVGLTTLAWLVTCFIGPQESRSVLQGFVDRVNPGGPGWRGFRKAGDDGTEPWKPAMGLRAFFAGAVLVYSLLFSGYFMLLSDWGQAFACIFLSVVSGWLIRRLWPKLQ